MVEKKKIALLYFSRNAQPEGRKKAWFSAGCAEKNQALAASLIHHSFHILQHSGLPVFHFHEGNQLGHSFGERIANAYQEVFDQGFDAVIAVGNDTPELAGVDWKNVITQLTSGQCVLGPTFRRGAYLIGITAEVFQKEIFQELPWQSRALLPALLQYCALEESTPSLLETLRDVNSYGDLKELVKSVGLDLYLKHFIRLLLMPRQMVFADQVNFVSRLPLLGHSPFRAPPISIA